MGNAEKETGKKKRSEAYLDILYELFSGGERHDLAELKDTLGCSLNSVRKYMEQLALKQGWEYIEEYGTGKDKKKYFRIAETAKQDTESGNIRKMDEDILRKYAIILQLQKKHYTETELKACFSFDSKGETDRNIEENDLLIQTDMKYGKFRQLLNELKDDGEIWQAEDNRLFLTGKSVPLIMWLEQDQMESLAAYLNAAAGGPADESLVSIRDQINAYLGYDFPEASHFITYGKKPKGLRQYNEVFEKLDGVHFQDHVLRITYDSGETELFAAGVLVYSVEKDICYVVGAVCTLENNVLIPGKEYKIHRLTTLMRAEDTAYHNDCFYQARFLEHVDKMFGFSEDREHEVLIEIEGDIKNIYSRFHRLAYGERKRTAILKQKENGDGYLYTDIICGISDFKKFLRQFGRSACVISPDYLRKDMAESVKQTLEHYRKEYPDECI